MTKFQGTFISQKMTLLAGEDDKHDPLAFDTSYESNNRQLDEMNDTGVESLPEK